MRAGPAEPPPPGLFPTLSSCPSRFALPSRLAGYTSSLIRQLAAASCIPRAPGRTPAGGPVPLHRVLVRDPPPCSAAGSEGRRLAPLSLVPSEPRSVWYVLVSGKLQKTLKGANDDGVSCQWNLDDVQETLWGYLILQGSPSFTVFNDLPRIQPDKLCNLRPYLEPLLWTKGCRFMEPKPTEPSRETREVPTWQGPASKVPFPAGREPEQIQRTSRGIHPNL